MSKELKLAIQIKAVDLATETLMKMKRNVEILAQSNAQLKAQYEALATSMRNMAIAVGITRQLYTGLFKPGIQAAAEYRATLVDIQGLLGDTSTSESVARVTSLMEKIKGIAGDIQDISPFDDVDILKTEQALIRARVAEEDLGEATKVVSQLGLIGKTDPATIASGVAKIAKAFKTDFTEAGNAIAKMTATTNNSIQSATDAFKFAGPILANYNVSVADAAKLMSLSGKEGRRAGSEVAQFVSKLGMSQRFIDPATHKLMAMDKIFKLLKVDADKLGDRAPAMFTRTFGTQMGSNLLQAVKSGKWEDLTKRYENALSLEQRFTMNMYTLDQQLKRIQNYKGDLLKNLFLPALPIVTELTKRTADLMAGINGIIEKSPTIKKAVSYGTMGAMGLGAAAAVFFGLKSIKNAGGILKSVGGIGNLLGGVAGGVAKGEALKRIAGVQPVYVTNVAEFKGGIAGGVGGIAGEVAGGAAAGGILSKLPKMFGGLLALANPAGKLALAGAGGYAIGTGLNYALDKVGIGEKMENALAWMMSSNYRKYSAMQSGARNRSIDVMQPTMSLDRMTPANIATPAPASSTHVQVYVNDEEKRDKRTIQYTNFDRGSMLVPVYALGQ